MSDPLTLVLDNGAHTARCGFAGDFAPSHQCRTRVAQVRGHGKHTKTYCGADLKRAPASSKPVDLFMDSSHARTDWTLVERFWQHLVAERLQVDHDFDARWMLVDRPGVPNAARGKTMEILFETLKAGGVFFAYAPSLTLYASGRTTGCAVDSGHLGTHVCPVLEGFLLPLQRKTLEHGGRSVTQRFQQLIEDASNHNRPSVLDFDTAEKLKEQYCQVADDAPNGLNCVEQNITLPDGSVVSLGNSAATAFPAEAQFGGAGGSGARASFGALPRGQEPIPHAVYRAVSSCEASLRRTMFGNVVVGGGNTLLKGWAQRLQKELVYLSPASMRVAVDASPQRAHAAWTGASVLSEQSQMDEVWIDQKLFEECGAQSAAVRCF